MYNKIKQLIILTAITLLTATNAMAIEPQDLGKDAFKKLKMIRQFNRANFHKHFLTLDELHQMAKLEDLITNKQTRQKMMDVNHEKWLKEIEECCLKIRKDGAQQGIEWRKIKYLDFFCEMEEDDGVTFCKGQLFFKFHGMPFSVRTVYIKTEDGFRLADINHLNYE